MIRQRQIDHKRKNSQLQLFHPSIGQYDSKKTSAIKDMNKQKAKSSQNNKKLKIPKQIKSSNNNKLEGRNILRLVQNSSKMRDKKLIVVEDIQHHTFNNNDENNINESNYYGGMYEGCQQSNDDNNNSSFFQFGRRSRSSQYKQQKPTINSTTESNQLMNKNINYELSMEQIMQVPDTMSNSRRYDNSNGKFYQFTTMLDKEHTQRKHLSNQTQNKKHQFSDNNNKDKMLQKLQSVQKQLFNNNNIIVKKQQTTATTKNLTLNKRKQKQPKLVINKQSLQKEKLVDFSSISCCNSKKKSKLLLVSNNNMSRKDDKKSKSKQLLKCINVNNNIYNNNYEKQREKLNISTLLVSSKKSKNIDTQSQGSLLKKKSLSLKDKNKSVLKLSSQKPACVNSRSLQNKSQTSLSIKKSKVGQQRPFISQKTNTNTNTKISQINQKIQLIQQSQSKLQSQYKILFQCVGQLWQNNRITRYISQKNKSDIIKLQEQQSKQQSKFIKLKSEILTAISSARY